MLLLANFEPVLEALIFSLVDSPLNDTRLVRFASEEVRDLFVKTVTALAVVGFCAFVAFHELEAFYQLLQMLPDFLLSWVLSVLTSRF